MARRNRWVVWAGIAIVVVCVAISVGSRHRTVRPRAETSVSAAATPPGSDRHCASLPSRCGYPDSSNTGVRDVGQLRSVPRDLTSGPGWQYDSRGFVAVFEPGAVLQDVDITVPVEVTASNATIENSRITVHGEIWGIGLRHTSAVTIRSVTIRRSEGQPRILVGVKDIYGDSRDTTIDRCDISGTATGVQIVAGSIQNSFVHDLAEQAGDHVNGVTSNGASTPLSITHNTILNPIGQTDAVGLFSDFSTEANRTVTDNLLAGGGYAVYAGQSSGRPGPSHIMVTDNRFSKIYFPHGGFFGSGTGWNSTDPSNVWTGNIWDEDGSVVDPP